MSDLKPLGRYCMYLRRSRADLEAERMGEGETLARHCGMLQELANRLLGRPIPESAIYREIVSGDTISERPEMRRLMRDVEQGMWDGVFVAEIDRLARGDTMDQGLVSQTFLYSRTLIITPAKTYDPEDMSDSEFFEIKLFFARREYQMIKRRMQTGRVNAVKEGLYAASRPIYGYERYKLPDRKGWSLKPNPEQAAVVRMIFEWYVNGMDGRSVGGTLIARRLNEMGIRTMYGKLWHEDRILNMLRNPTYVGCVQWDKRKEYTRMQDGKKVKIRVRTDAPIIAEGVHEAIVSGELFEQANARIRQRGKAPLGEKRGMINPLAGLIRCGRCGYAMRLWVRRDRPEWSLIKCSNNHCDCHSAYYTAVEGVILDALREWVTYEPDKIAPPEPREEQDDCAALIVAQSRQIEALERQLSKLRDLLERGVYGVEVYLSREREIKDRISACERSLAVIRLREKSKEETIAALAQKIRGVLDLYDAAKMPEEKNALLKSVISKAVYFKAGRTPRGHSPLETLKIEIFPLDRGAL